MPRTHLFLAMGNGAFGEAVLGLRLAEALHARGDRILFLAPSSLSVVLKDAPFRVGLTDAIATRVDLAVLDLLAAERCDDLVLVDLASVFLSLSLHGRAATFLRAMPVPVLALDVWNLPATDLVWDALGARWDLPREALAVERRLVPVPFVAPDVAGGYDALPAGARVDRTKARARLGLADEDRLLITTTATWQRPRAQPDAVSAEAAAMLPRVLFDHLATLGPRVRVLHVGPEAFGATALGDRYHWQAPVPAPRFAEFLAAGDLLLSLNLSATTVGAAIANQLPVVIATNSFAGTPDEIAAALPSPPSPEVRRWLALKPSHQRFRVWPLGLHDFLGPVFAGNPYCATFASAEVLDLPGLRQTCAQLLFEPAVADAQRQHQQAYARQVRALPSPADAFDRVRS
ncbi:MAG: DUF6365 family protein [Deltaproteobacteria bacterium]|nr:DUF6365 family protein [Deltaproteobacteria bacterium]